MLRSLNDLESYKVTATDGDIGNAENFFLDDERWAIRYLVVGTNDFLDGKRVLISPIALQDAEWSNRRFHVALTREKVKHSPNVDLDKPVSRQQEADQDRYYGYASYWGYTGGLWGMGPTPNLLRPDSGPPPERPSQHTGDIHLRSAKELTGYDIQGKDGALGRLADFIVDDQTWAIRYLTLEIGSWWAGKKVLVAPQWASRVSWEDRKIFLGISREKIKASPEWNGEAAINREYEQRMYDHYGRPVYWIGGDHPTDSKDITRAAAAADLP
jgi:hypothetical protein